MRPTILILTPLPLLLAACATAAPERLRFMPHDKDPQTSALCMAPNGEGLPWQAIPHPTGEGGYACPAPAFFVPMPRCAPGEPTWMDETPEHRALRLRFGRDGSLVGDSWQGRRFCMPTSPH